MCRPAPLTLSFSADDHTSCGHIFHAFSVFPVLLLSQLGSIRTLWIHSGDWYIAVHKHTPSSSISGSSAFHVSLRTWGWPVQHIKFCISQLFFFFFLTDTAEYRKCYPHIYSSLDASFSLNLLFTCAGVFIATVGRKAAELPHVCLACLPLALTPPPHHHPSILGEKRS